ncbi:DUF3137 domain-containing protein [Aliinostoc sp. HNIBRCY26]|uniref:DUF3137 domain-containing protein n=1 Tax=Aliinostoc sp. HNIBRCY26 TaxID=3418997 RepID=UPI003D074084
MAKSKIFLTSEQAINLINSGYQAIAQKRYITAIKNLQKFCQAAHPSTKHYLQAHKTLFKLYQECGQNNQAIALQQKLLNSQDTVTRNWAENLALTDIESVDVTKQTESEITDLSEEPGIENFQPQNINKFKKFCQTELLDELQKIEYIRKQVLYLILLVHIVFLTISITIILNFLSSFYPLYDLFASDLDYLISENDSNDITVRLIIFVMFFFLPLLCHISFIILTIWIWTLVYSSIYARFAKAMKLKIPEAIFNFIDEDKHLKYFNYFTKEKEIEILHSFQHSQILQGVVKSNNIIKDNYIEGRVNGVKIWFANIRAEIELKHDGSNSSDLTNLAINQEIIKTTKKSKNKFWLFNSILSNLILPIAYISSLCWRCLKSISYMLNTVLRGRSVDSQRFTSEIVNNEGKQISVIFKGLFFTAKSHKNSQTAITILPKSININIHALHHGTKQLIKLESPTFERFFTVYSDDQVAARYILSTDLIHKIVRFRQKTNKNIYISFVDNMIYIGIEELLDNEIFEPNLYKNSLRFAPLKEYFENINLVLSIVEDLNLNRNIYQDS